MGDIIGQLKAWVLRLLLVPAEPALPPDSRTLRVFRAAPAYYRYRLLLWALKQTAAAIGLIAGFIGITLFLRIGDPGPVLVILLRTIEVLAWLLFAVQLPLTLAVLHLDFEMRWYILSDRSLRVREGILKLREKTITYANIQNVEIRQNPLQQLLRIADVRVRSAGGGGGGKDPHNPVGESMHEASFRGVDNAVEIRAAIAERARSHRDAGLGDPDDTGRLPAPSPGHAAPHEPTAAAARHLLEEATLLRQVLEGRA